MVEGGFSPFAGFGFCKPFEFTQQPDSILAVIAAVGAKFIENDRSFLTGSVLIASMYRFNVLALGSWTHFFPPVGSRCLVTSNYESTIPS